MRFFHPFDITLKSESGKSKVLFGKHFGKRGPNCLAYRQQKNLSLTSTQKQNMSKIEEEKM